MVRPSTKIGWRSTTIALLKPNGRIADKNYKGVLLQWSYWLPWDRKVELEIPF